MCYYFYDGSRWLKDLKPFEAILMDIHRDTFETLRIGFDHPKVLVVSNSPAEPVQLMEWGLQPFWAKTKSPKMNTLNARVETLAEKPSFKSSLKNRCLIPSTGFIEWQWLDPKGKEKQKYRVQVAGEPGFFFAGLYSNWTDRQTGEVIPTFTLITREAEGLMREIHNSKLRMPMIVKTEQWDDWLNCTIDVVDPPELVAEKI